MSLDHASFFQPHRRHGLALPWQFRARPVLFTTVSAIVAALLLVGALVCARRLVGSLNAELSPDAMLLLALTSSSTIAFSRIAWRRSFPLESPLDLSSTDVTLGWASSAALAMLAVGCCYPGYRTADWLIWLPILVADQLWRQSFFDAGEPNTSSGNLDVSFSNELSSEPTLAVADTPNHQNIVQQLYRLRDESDNEVIYGTVRADFVAGQRTAVVHVGFCPPLKYVPEIEAEALPGTLANIKIVQAFAHGTRLDVRLPATASDDCSLWIDMAARPIDTADATVSA